MARKVRFEYPGACYHVINRGNYRSRIFESEGARKSFVGTLRECCEAQGWCLHAWCLMSNHYHLLLETPEPNLVDGMRWLQSVFANRFNRFRKENGHVFQGRYKSIVLEDAAMGPVAHYIHLCLNWPRRPQSNLNRELMEFHENRLSYSELRR